MAFSGLHVVCGYAGGRGYMSTMQALFARQIWSEDPASITTNIAPPVTDTDGAPIFRIRAAADSWVSIGQSPNASTGIRFLVPAGTDYDVYATPGDKLAWVVA